MRLTRRKFLIGAGAAALLPLGSSVTLASSPAKSRVRPSDPAWPGETEWAALNERVHGRLLKVSSPFNSCRPAYDSDECVALFRQLTNPYFIHDQAGLTQTLGRLDACTSSPPAHALIA